MINRLWPVLILILLTGCTSAAVAAAPGSDPYAAMSAGQATAQAAQAQVNATQSAQDDRRLAMDEQAQRATLAAQQTHDSRSAEMTSTWQALAVRATTQAFTATMTAQAAAAIQAAADYSHTATVGAANARMAQATAQSVDLAARQAEDMRVLSQNATVTAAVWQTEHDRSQAAASASRKAFWSNTFFLLLVVVVLAATGVGLLALWRLVEENRLRISALARRAGVIETSQGVVNILPDGRVQPLILVDVDHQLPAGVGIPDAGHALPAGEDHGQQAQLPEMQIFIVNCARAHVDGWRGETIPRYDDLRRKCGATLGSNGGEWQRLTDQLAALLLIDKRQGRTTTITTEPPTLERLLHAWAETQMRPDDNAYAEFEAQCVLSTPPPYPTEG